MLDDVSFPAADHMREGFWQPIYFHPNFDSPERLIVGVIANVGGKWEVARASALERLRCLYGAESATALQAINHGLDYLEGAVGAEDYEADLSGVVSGLEVGERSLAQARDAPELARHWIRLVSSLHSAQKHLMTVSESMPSSPVDAVQRDISKDRLPVLVLAEMTKVAPSMRSMFNPHIIRLEQEHGARLLTHKAFVAFTGKRLAANFATVKPGQQKAAANIAKRLMWDLEQHREYEGKLLPRHAHEMLLYHPSKDDPTISTRQYANVMDVVETLKSEGQNREIGVRAYESVPEIADHVIETEGVERR
jgi:hypothetical protein